MSSNQKPAELRRALGLVDLVLFNVVAIVGLRWVATAAATGASSMFLWVLAFLVFFLPSGLAVVVLSTRYPQEGGIYIWTKRAFGDWHGFMCGWCYWTANLVYFPSLLIYAAGNAAFIFGEEYGHLAGSKAFVVIFSFGALWLAVALNVVGLQTSKWLSNLGAIGTWVPATLLVTLGGWALWKFGSATSWGRSDLLPDFGSLGTLSFWATMCFGFAGLELAPTMGDEIRNPGKNIPRAIVLSGIVVTGIYVLGTLALLIALPRSEISVISGVVEAINHASSRLGAIPFGAVCALLIALGGIGGANSWLAGSARLPFVAGVDRYLPESFARLHPRFGTPYTSILAQGVLSSLFLLMSVVGGETTVKEAYLVLVDMSIIVYFIPFLYLFGSLIRLGKPSLPTDPSEGAGHRGRGAGIILAGVLGLAATGVSLALALVPPEGVTNSVLFELKLVGGCLIFIGAGALFPIIFRRK
ncbi:MAG: amino acid permease [Acidobacteria bacterium]|nr:amino acid permease [Acidobacteriota bacterium]